MKRHESPSGDINRDVRLKKYQHFLTPKGRELKREFVRKYFTMICFIHASVNCVWTFHLSYIILFSNPLL
jgi:hypothetical protein